MQQMTKKFNQPTVEDLIATIGYGGICLLYTSQVDVMQMQLTLTEML